jgi:hypothetical protein
VLYGASNPTAGTGVDGNFYINTSTNFIYGPKAAGAWPAGISLVGPQGPIGNTGPQGVAGNTVLYGTSDPTSGIGVNGNFYINTASNYLFGPKTSGAWPAGTSLVGPQGPQGIPGAGSPATVPPLMDGAAAIGTSTNFARQDHVHPSDTAKADKSYVDTADALKADKTYVDTQDALKAPLASPAFTGNPTVNGTLTVAGSISAGDITASRSGTAGYYFYGSSGYIGFDGANFVTQGGTQFVSSATFRSSHGYCCTAGDGGAVRSNRFNIDWSPQNLWIDATNLGTITTSSDYRIKKDVLPLPAMWDTVKALRPIQYTQAQFTPPSQIKAYAADKLKAEQAAQEQGIDPPQEAYGPLFAADDIERWGFIAHELQETLTPSAATGVKDAPDTIQSPNPFTVIAALTKALQEAMARIEALEARP